MKVTRFNNAESRVEQVMLSSKEQILMMSEEIRVLRSELSIYKAEISLRNSGTAKPSSVSSLEKKSFLVNVSYLYRSEELINKLTEKGYKAEIYSPPENKEQLYRDNKSHTAIWLGKNVSLEAAQQIIGVSTEFYKHLKYVLISGDLGDDPPEEIHDQIYIGGSTNSAIGFGLIAFSREDFSKLTTADTIQDMHAIIRAKYSKNS